MGAEAFARFGHMVVSPGGVRERATGTSWSNGLAVQAGFMPAHLLIAHIPPRVREPNIGKCRDGCAFLSGEGSSLAH